MKTIGLLGGMSWESTILYYEVLNRGVRERLGGLHSAKILLHSVDFAEIEYCQVTGQWQKAGALLGAAACGLQTAGADMVLLCTNLMHKVAPQIESHIQIPLLHIADAAGREIVRQGLKKVGLLGAIYTMEEDFYRQRLLEKFGIEVVIPARKERELVQRVIFEELCRGEFRAESKAAYLAIIDGLREQGADGVILGCTEIPLLVKPEDTSLPLFNTAALHAGYALEESLKGE
ncbi:aspartate/glutamate racemase family protein [Geopsychrobacter electrodiphilus]|uniref:aspartate/glutamate racemase family protein n=1 Tax=Geopsychrobacter electrodiphilus TaxID=225196 RepID=UPI00038081AF|nr:amino acid racemase [Geopsychrobacter electrodiphilus]